MVEGENMGGQTNMSQSRCKQTGQNVRRPNFPLPSPSSGRRRAERGPVGKGRQRGHKPRRLHSPDTGPDDINRPEFVKKSKVVIIISRYKRVNRPHSARRKVVVGKPCRPCLVFSFLLFFFLGRDEGHCCEPSSPSLPNVCQP